MHRNALCLVQAPPLRLQGNPLQAGFFPKPKVEGIIFDMDGVLVDSRRAAAKALMRVSEKEGLKAGKPEVVLALESGNSAISIVSALFKEKCQCPDEARRLANAYAQESIALCNEISPTKIAAMLPELSMGYSLSIATNRAKDAALHILERLGLLQFFAAVITLADAPQKPHPKMVLLALAAMGVCKSAAVFVGDKESDWLAGKAAGVRTIMVDGSKGEAGCKPFLREFA